MRGSSKLGVQILKQKILGSLKENIKFLLTFRERKSLFGVQIFKQKIRGGFEEQYKFFIDISSGRGPTRLEARILNQEIL